MDLCQQGVEDMKILIKKAILCFLIFSTIGCCLANISYSARGPVKKEVLPCGHLKLTQTDSSVFVENAMLTVTFPELSKKKQKSILAIDDIVHNDFSSYMIFVENEYVIYNRNNEHLTINTALPLYFASFRNELTVTLNNILNDYTAVKNDDMEPFLNIYKKTEIPLSKESGAINSSYDTTSFLYDERVQYAIMEFKLKPGENRIKISYFKSIALYGFGTWGDFNMDRPGMIGFHYYLEPIRSWKLSEDFTFTMKCNVPDYKKMSFFFLPSWKTYSLISNISMSKQYSSEKKMSIYETIKKEVGEKFVSIILIQE
jgi:hypothetical protein